MNQRRGLFQIHLMTAIVLMFAAGGLIKLNMGREARVVVGGYYGGRQSGAVISETRLYGWPLLAHNLENFELDAPQKSTDRYAAWGHFPFETNPEMSWSWIAVDVVIALFILVGLAIVCEWLLRRSKRSKILTVQPASL